MMHWQRHVSVVTNHVRPKIVNSAPWFGTAFCCFCFCRSFGIEHPKKDFQQIDLAGIEANGRPGRHAHAAHFKRPEDERF